MEYIIQHPAICGLAAGLVTWIFTAIGAGAVFLKKNFSRKTLDAFLGLAAGVMLAASVWSLLLPALDLAQTSWGAWRFLPVAAGFLLGSAALWLMNLALPHIHPGIERKEGLGASRLPRHTLLLLAITLHNIPEALAVGVAFGALAVDPNLGVASAVTLMLGIGLQNLPEGMAVSVPLLREGYSRKKAFFFGQLSGLVEPFSALLGALLASVALPFLPWAMSLAAGAMVYVTIEEVLPEAQGNGNSDAAAFGVLIGFALMMSLDVVFS